MLNLATVLETAARDYPDHCAIVFGGHRMTYRELNAAANKAANALREAGVRQGDKVALSCPNLPAFPVVYYGILKAGAVAAPLNVLLKRKEISYHLADSDAVAYFCFEGARHLPMLEEGAAAFAEVETCKHFFVITADPAAPCPVEGATTLGQLLTGQPPESSAAVTGPDDTAVILYTSGTTGQPKGAELTHANMVLNAFVSRDLHGGGPEDRQLIALPLFHSFGQTVQMNAGVLGGSALVLLPRFEASAAVKAFLDEGITIFCGVPTMFSDILRVRDLSDEDVNRISQTLRIGVSGGAAIPVDLLRRFEERFNIPILEGYGLSETSPVATFNRRDRPRKPGSIGLPVWGVEARVVDSASSPLPPEEPGEIVIRGHNVMKGYYKRPEATAETIRDGWLHTGDIGKMDEDGYLYVVDRLKDMILRAGFNIYPREIEETLLAHPDVAAAAVIGVPDREFGEEVKACVVLEPGATLTAAEVRAWARTEMAKYKCPRYVEIREALPMNATGKILKRELRQAAQA